MHITVEKLMETSGVGFGTSGARGLADEITDLVAYVYTQGFLSYLAASGQMGGDCKVAVAGDLRPSTGRIMRAVMKAAADYGCGVINCGTVPSPAVMLYGLEHAIPSVMVTGSHIPADRNGIKFNKPAGEILKADEAGIRGRKISCPDALFDTAGAFTACDYPLPAVSNAASGAYIRRYSDIFASDSLQGMRLGVYQHSAVGRDIVLQVLRDLGADAVPLGRSDTFIPVDTEAIRPEDSRLAAAWAAEYGFDAIISTDGDSDRPLISDEHGSWLRGDIAGILTARFLGADSVSTPVSCNTAVEKSGFFSEVRRTRIGSPYVIESMDAAAAAGAARVVGYEANGGFLTNTDIPIAGSVLPALPTRDALIVPITILLQAAERSLPVSGLLAELPGRYTFSGRIQEFPTAKSREILKRFSGPDAAADRDRASAVFGSLCGSCRVIDRTDGVRMIFENEEVIHLRPSGNAPEFRCYTEADSDARARELNRQCLEIVSSLE